MKLSKSPSNTAVQFEVSNPVLKSLILDESRTYDLIWLPHPISALDSSKDFLS